VFHGDTLSILQVQYTLTRTTHKPPNFFPARIESFTVRFTTYLCELDSLNRTWFKTDALKQLGEAIDYFQVDGQLIVSVTRDCDFLEPGSKQAALACVRHVVIVDL